MSALFVTVGGGELVDTGRNAGNSHAFEVTQTNYAQPVTFLLTKDEAAQWAKVLAEYADGAK